MFYMCATDNYIRGQRGGRQDAQTSQQPGILTATGFK